MIVPTLKNMDQKKAWVMVIVLAGCVLTLLLQKSANVVENGPMLVHLDTPDDLANMFGDTRLLEDSDTVQSLSTPKANAEDDPFRYTGKVSVADLMLKSLHGSSVMTALQDSDSDGEKGTVDDESSIADIWREEDIDNGTWKIFEEEYKKIDWKQNKDGFNRWR